MGPVSLTKAIVIDRPGSFSFQEKLLPSLAANQVLVEISSAAVNPADTYMCQGIYTNQPSWPFTPGIEGAGRVAAVGDAVATLSVGDRIAFVAAAADGGTGASSGSWSCHCVINASLAWRVPDSIDLSVAASLPTAYLTAHRALFQIARALPHEGILIRGASGAVGMAAVHLASHFGAPGRLVVGTASTEAGRASVRKRGAHACGHGDVDIRDSIGTVQFDVILELMGNQNLGSDVNLIAAHGRIAVIGSRPGGGFVNVDARQILVKEATLHGVFLWKMTPSERDAAYVDISNALERGAELLPVQTFDLLAAEEAYQIVSGQAAGVGGTAGKVLLLPPPTSSRL